MLLHLTINGAQRELTIAPGDLLLDVLREAGYWSVKRGCETGDCGACTILLDGVPLASCLLFAAQAEGRAVTTVEALGTTGRPHPLMLAFADMGAVQCGFCTPGMILSAKALLDDNLDPSEADVQAALDGHLCRCTGYVKPIEAVLHAAAILREARDRPTRASGDREDRP
jgi:aerobic-type carbon monoxide dehydrogenase small subunit (CoxS/CutS family)